MSFFGFFGGGDITEFDDDGTGAQPDSHQRPSPLPPSPQSQEAQQPQQSLKASKVNTTAPGPPPLADRSKWLRNMSRWNRTITPASPEFVQVYQTFATKLQTLSPEAVVVEEFSRHEVRKFLNGFVDKARLRAIYDDQRADKVAYAALIADGATFANANFPAEIQNPAPLPKKLAMMYFGFPVEPMKFTDPLQLNGTSLFANLAFESTFDDDDDFDDEDFSFVPEELRPLRFLNYYDRRGFGKDNSHMNPDKTYELFYGIPMVLPTNELASRLGLRGAGVNDASDDEDSTMDPVDQPDATVSHDKSTSIQTVSPHIALCGDQEGARTGEQVYLWGLSGRTAFSYLDAKSFFSAIDRLLGLNKRGDEATAVGITISLLSHPKGQRGPCTVLASDQCFLGQSEQDELNFHKTWLETVQYFDDKIEDGQALDICVAQISQDIHFSELQEELTYQPSLEDDKIVSFSLFGDEADARSYLSMTNGVSEETAASHYQMWFKSLWRTLSRPTEEQLKSYSVGSKQVVAPRSCLINITTRSDADRSEGAHWFYSDVGPTLEAWKWFTDAYYRDGQREFVLHAIPMNDPRASTISLPANASSATTCTASVEPARVELDRQFYWGSHRRNEDTVVFMMSHKNTIMPGRTKKGVQLDDFAKGKAFREWSYAHPLSINMQGQQPTIPINAPPLDAILKTGGANGSVAQSVPIMSTAVLTPSEQRHLQETVFEMRSLALNRAQPCPFRPCRQHFAIDEDGRVDFREHIQEFHIDKKCPLCEDRNFGYWNAEAKQQHFYAEHVNYFSHKDDLYFNTVFKVESLNRVDAREKAWNFCARCGRNHMDLNVPGDRTQHDNVCFPGAPDYLVTSKYCIHDGEEEYGVDADGRPIKHVCKGVLKVQDANDVATTAVHCTKCALPTHLLSRSYAEKHLYRCTGKGNDPAHWCPWCGIQLSIHPRTTVHAHLNACGRQPKGGAAEGPLDTAKGEPRDSPWDSAMRRAGGKAPGSSKSIAVPDACTFAAGGCYEEVSKLNANALFDHYSAEHLAPTTDLSVCPFCQLDFGKRQFMERTAKVAHFQDHIEKRGVRLGLDLAIADAPNKLDPLVLDMVRRRNLDEFAPTAGFTSVSEVQQAMMQEVAGLRETVAGLSDTVQILVTKVDALASTGSVPAPAPAPGGTKRPAEGRATPDQAPKKPKTASQSPSRTHTPRRSTRLSKKSSPTPSRTLAPPASEGLSASPRPDGFRPFNRAGRTILSPESVPIVLAESPVSPKSKLRSLPLRAVASGSGTRARRAGIRRVWEVTEGDIEAQLDQMEELGFGTDSSEDPEEWQAVSID